jgi:hypothetical protein
MRGVDTFRSIFVNGSDKNLFLNDDLDHLAFDNTTSLHPLKQLEELRAESNANSSLGSNG